VFLAGSLIASVPAQAGPDSPIGLWKTIDDETGDPKVHVRIWKDDEGAYHGTIEKLVRKPGEDPDPICKECPGDKKPLIRGLTILTNMSSSGDTYDGGEIFDPDNGKTYTCKLWLDNPNELSIRGYWGPFYRTQTCIASSRVAPLRASEHDHRDVLSLYPAVLAI